MAKYVTIKVSIKKDSNAFEITQAVVEGLMHNNVSQKEIEAYKLESFQGNMDHLIATAENLVTVKWI